MLPIVLVLLFASSALAGPQGYVNLQAVPEYSVEPPYDNGQGINGYSVGAIMDVIDGGDVNVAILAAQGAISDMANSPDPTTQATAMGQALAMIGELAYGTPGDACAAANLVDAYAYAYRSGNYGGIQSALGNYVSSLLNNLSLIASLSRNPSSTRYSSGPVYGCAGGGRSYDFESAWEGILANANAYSGSYLTEQYCAAKRLYYALSTRSNNVGAAITAASLPPVAETLARALPHLGSFARAIASKGDPSSALAAIQGALG